jgi:prepilin peptidase CpaA
MRLQHRCCGHLMALGLNLIALLGFAGLMAAAAIEDFRRLIIPNPVVVALCALWPLHLATAADANLAAGLAAIGCAAAAFLVGAAVFARGLIGGGDVKLFSAAALWAGPDRVAPLLAVTGLIGGVLALAFLSPLGTRISARRGFAGDQADAAASAGLETPLPYGVAIAAAALIVTIHPGHG